MNAINYLNWKENSYCEATCETLNLLLASTTFSKLVVNSKIRSPFLFTIFSTINIIVIKMKRKIKKERIIVEIFQYFILFSLFSMIDYAMIKTFFYVIHHLCNTIYIFWRDILQTQISYVHLKCCGMNKSNLECCVLHRDSV